MTYYISDTHFGHENIIDICKRPFDNVRDMNERLIYNWNKKVKGSDTVYILGDMFYRCEDPVSILEQLKGKKKLLVGNHDGGWMKKVDLPSYFASVDTMIEASVDNRGVTMCHYPLVMYRHNKRAYMIHGHIHNNTNIELWRILRSQPRVLNAGVDINGFEPVSFEELAENNRRFKELHAL